MFHDFKCMISKCYDFQSVTISSILVSKKLYFESIMNFFKGEYMFEMEMINYFDLNIVSKQKWFLFRSINYFDWINSFEIKMVYGFKV